MSEHDEPEMKVLVIHESVLASMIKDFFSLGMVVAVLYANYLWGESNWVVNAFAAILSFLFILSKTGPNTFEVVTLGDLRKFIASVDRINGVKNDKS